MLWFNLRFRFHVRAFAMRWWCIAACQLANGRVAAWDPHRFLPRYAEAFIEEVVAHCVIDFPGRAYIQGAPVLPKPNVE